MRTPERRRCCPRWPAAALDLPVAVRSRREVRPATPAQPGDPPPPPRPSGGATMTGSVIGAIGSSAAAAPDTGRGVDDRWSDRAVVGGISSAAAACAAACRGWPDGTSGIAPPPPPPPPGGRQAPAESVVGRCGGFVGSVVVVVACRRMAGVCRGAVDGAPWLGVVRGVAVAVAVSPWPVSVVGVVAVASSTCRCRRGRARTCRPSSGVVGRRAAVRLSVPLSR